MIEVNGRLQANCDDLKVHIGLTLKQFCSLYPILRNEVGQFRRFTVPLLQKEFSLRFLYSFAPKRILFAAFNIPFALKRILFIAFIILFALKRIMFIAFNILFALKR